MSTSQRTRRANPTLLSFVIPVHNEEEVLPALRARLQSLVPKLPCPAEWIFVDDGSTDGSGSFLFAWAGQDPRVKILRLSRNFGHQSAITAGTDFTRGDAVLILDADLQDPPELILEMLPKYMEGYDVIYAQRIKRLGEGIFKRATAWVYYRMMRKLVDKRLPLNTGDFRLMSREVVESLRHMREGQRFLRGMVSWLGFNQISVPFERAPRHGGQTKFPFRKMLRFAMDGILSFSSLPLRVGLMTGGALFLFGLAYLGYYCVHKFFYDDLVRGWTSLIAIQCVIGGAILVSLGIIGEYIGRIYEELKGRPMYVVSDFANLSVQQLPQRAVIAHAEAMTMEKAA